MDEAGVIQASALDEARRVRMRTPDEVAAMLGLKARGWGVKRIAREFGTCPKTVARRGDTGGGVQCPPACLCPALARAAAGLRSVSGPH